MSRPRPHPLIAALCALFLLGAQQAAYAHFLSHFGFAQHTAVQPDNDAEHGAASSLSHVCTTCAAFAALDAPPPTTVATMPPDQAGAASPASNPRTYIPAPVAPYASRAPPNVF